MIRCIAVLSLAVLAASQETTTAIPQVGGFAEVAQCRCSEMDECASSILKKTSICKNKEKCTAYLGQIGKVDKVLACLDKDHEAMSRLEACAKKKVNGELGCTNSETPINMTIPLIPVIEVPSLEESGAAAAQANAGEAHPAKPPMQLTQYLMCVDECALDDMEVIPGRKKRSPVNCAFKLKCALAPPSADTQTAYAECQKELKFDPTEGAAASCRCLKDAGVPMECP